MTLAFKATDEQVAKIIANAVSASEPVGMGFMHFVPGEKEASLFEDRVKSGQVHLDYYQGRMVKLSIKRVNDDNWALSPAVPRIDYQSWARVFPTGKDLVKSAGVTVD